MLIKDFLEKFNKIWAWLVVIILVAGGLGALWGGFAKKPIKAAVSLDIVFSGQQEADDFKYDGYYAILAADEFSKSVQFWLKNQKTINDIFLTAAINNKQLQPRANFFEVKKLSPQYLEVEYGTKEPGQAEAIATSLQKVLSGRAQKLSDSSSQGISFDILVAEPLIWRSQKNNILNNLLIGVFIGIVISLLTVLALIKPKE